MQYRKTTDLKQDNTIHRHMLQIRCTNNNVTKSFPEGTSLLDVYQEFADEIKLPYPVVSAKVNNTPQGLKFRLYQNRDVEFLDAREGSGHRVYVRSLSFVLYKATQDLFPGSKLFIEHSLCRGYYCNFKKKSNEPLTDENVKQLCQRIQEIIDLDMPFRRTEATTEEALRVFSERGFSDKVKLIETSGQIYTDYYTLGDTVDYYYGPLVPSGGRCEQGCPEGTCIGAHTGERGPAGEKDCEDSRRDSRQGGERQGEDCAHHRTIELRKDYVLQATVSTASGMRTETAVVLNRRLLREQSGHAEAT